VKDANAVQDVQPDFQFEFRLVEKRFARLWGVAIALGLLLVASLAWSLGLSRTARRNGSGLSGVHALVDSLALTTRADTARYEPLEERLTSFSDLEHRISTKADRSTMAAIQTRLDAIGAQLDLTDSLLATLETHEARDAGTRTLALATQDSIAAERRDVLARFARMDSTDLNQQSRLEALDIRIGALDDARKRSGRGTALRDGVTLVNTGMIVAHILGHSGR
jgi:hypothetical protein